MHLTMEIPDDLADRLTAEGVDLSRSALEAFALQEYKDDRINKDEMRKLLGIASLYELDGFLKAHDVWIEITLDEVLDQVKTLERMGI